MKKQKIFLSNLNIRIKTEDHNKLKTHSKERNESISKYTRKIITNFFHWKLELIDNEKQKNQTKLNAVKKSISDIKTKEYNKLF